METASLLLALAVVVIALHSAIKGAQIPATSSDWYVVFDINAEKKVLGIWFYPIVAFEHKDNQTLAVTSRPDYTKKLAASRLAKKISDGMWGVSVSYGRWLRNGVPFDEAGNPDLRTPRTFHQPSLAI